MDVQEYSYFLYSAVQGGLCRHEEEVLSGHHWEDGRASNVWLRNSQTSTRLGRICNVCFLFLNFRNITAASQADNTLKPIMAKYPVRCRRWRGNASAMMGTSNQHVLRQSYTRRWAGRTGLWSERRESLSLHFRIKHRYNVSGVSMPRFHG